MSADPELLAEGYRECREEMQDTHRAFATAYAAFLADFPEPRPSDHPTTGPKEAGADATA